MIRRLLATLAVFYLMLATVAAASTGLDQSSKQPPSYAEIRANQALGRAIASPDGHFFVYEWTRPYNWVRDFGPLPPAVASHMQTWLYRVDVDRTPPTSEYVFFPAPGASYWLGSLSPDAKNLSFYMLDEDNKLQAGVYNMASSKLTWFAPAPDAQRLSESPVWVSNEELIYPSSGMAGFARVNAATGQAQPCGDCEALVKKAKAARHDTLKAAAPGELGPDTRLLAQSQGGALTVYAKDTPDMLSLMFKKGSAPPKTVFENMRH